jgi:NAD(P)-dependent dehydrogenase (short-subunit alcohol dehydrogenase family)
LFSFATEIHREACANNVTGRHIRVKDMAAMTRPTALVTGASYGVGAAAALALARAGYDVAITATRAQNLSETVTTLDALGGQVLPLILDLGSRPGIERAVHEIVAAFGGLDLLVNNAGTNLRALAINVTPAQWDEMITVNVTGTFHLTQQVGRHFIEERRAGAVVTIASTHALIGAPERSTYGIVKAAQVQMTRMLAVEWAEHGIRVNAIAPGRMETASPSRATKGADPKYMKAMFDRIPLHRLCTPEEVAAAVVYLASPQAASITGQVLVLDGGLTAV